MEDELRCFACKQFYCEPVLLSCGHALCRSCAIGVQSPTGEIDNSSSGSGDYQEADKESLSSETDSGVVCGSRPSSYAGVPTATIYSNPSIVLTCPICSKQMLFDEHGADNLSSYRVMRNIVERYAGSAPSPTPIEEACQMCEGEKRAAVVRCEQCSVRYCTACRDAWHPTRGPLAQHVLKTIGTSCVEHAAAPTAYCKDCAVSACPRCVIDKHHNHDTLILASAARALKTELSQCLQQLSEQAKTMTEYIQLVKGSGDKINESCDELEIHINSQCKAITQMVEAQRDTLVRIARGERTKAIADIKTRTAIATGRLHTAAALLHFSIEALKETDNASFLQIGNVLSLRANDTAVMLKSSMDPLPVAPELNLDVEPVERAIRRLNFVECTPPAAPEMAVESCAARGNSATLAWRAQAAPRAAVRGFVLELDDGLGGPFREVYCGRETVCTVDGLHYASLYSARVKAFNGAGEGAYSEVIGLQTAPVAWFTWDATCAAEGAPSGLQLSADGLGAAVQGWEHRVALADAPLARGRHYWRLRIQRYEGDADPAFGVARADVARDKMLGSDALGWAMYIDSARSWFVHGGAHGGRAPGGVHAGICVGVLLDLTRGTLRFTVNDRPQGGIAFSGLHGVFYPAISLNRGVAVTLEPGLTPPDDAELDLDVQFNAVSLDGDETL